MTQEYQDYCNANYSEKDIPHHEEGPMTTIELLRLQDEPGTPFTAGPWRAEGPDMFGDYNILHQADSLAIAAVVSNMRGPNEVAANAQLVAGAPALRAENERLRAALKPFAGAVYNDNGAMSVSPCGYDDYVKAYFVMRDLSRADAQIGRGDK